ncbi:MAG: hypothetical protein GWP06_13645 [Actinobacteria bacterium]|nr:hypothetical protein [Actinomycetota bacterium]
MPHTVRSGPTWFPKSDRLAYIPWNQIWSVGLDGSSPTLMLDKSGLLFAPSWSPDGKRIFFKWLQGDMRDIWWLAADERGQPKGSVKPVSSGLNVANFSISNDGRKLVYSTIDYQHNIYSLPITKHRKLSLADAKPITSEKWYMGRGVVLAMSPDYEWITFMPHRGGYQQIWIVQKNGENLRPITADSSSKCGVRWDPDGEHIAFTTNEDIYTISIKGGPATPLLADSSYENWPSWSHDGEKIVFVSDRSGNSDLWITPVIGGEAEQLTTHEADDYAPLWSPDGDKISFGSDRVGSHDIYLYLVNSREIKKLTSVHSPDYIGHDWSPDGKKIYINYQPGENQFSRIISEITVQDGSMRTIFESKRSTIQDMLGTGIITDGEFVYFMKQHHGGESWIADLVYE